MFFYLIQSLLSIRSKRKYQSTRLQIKDDKVDDMGAIVFLMPG